MSNIGDFKRTYKKDKNIYSLLICFLLEFVVEATFAPGTLLVVSSQA